MANERIKKYAKESGVYHWQIAERLGIGDFYFSRKLRRELPEAEQDKIKTIIRDLAAERKAVE